MDGLGNQMFQYAFGRYIQTVYKEPIVFETMKLNESSVRRVGIHNCNIPIVEKHPGAEQCRFAGSAENAVLQGISKGVRIAAEKIFGIPMTGSDSYSKMIKYGYYTTTDSLAYYPFEKTTAKTKFVRGYFQSEKYFEPISPTIKDELKIVRGLTQKAIEQAEIMKNQQSVCVHIRRGDYIGHKRYDVCGYDYYKNAFELMNIKIPNSVYYIFSNSEKDLEWIKNNYKFSVKVNYVTQGKSEFDDLYMMYNCKNHIISNSTFGWWASFLCDNTDNITIAPQQWVKTDEQQDILRDKWICI